MEEIEESIEQKAHFTGSFVESNGLPRTPGGGKGAYCHCTFPFHAAHKAQLTGSFVESNWLPRSPQGGKGAYFSCTFCSRMPPLNFAHGFFVIRRVCSCVSVVWASVLATIHARLVTGSIVRSYVPCTFLSENQVDVTAHSSVPNALHADICLAGSMSAFILRYARESLLEIINTWRKLRKALIIKHIYRFLRQIE